MTTTYYDQPITKLANPLIPTSVEPLITTPAALKVKLFADGANLEGMLEMYKNPYIKGFTTNPSLMKKAGVADYFQFAKTFVEHISDRSISLEVFSDDFSTMKNQALKLAKLGEQVYVKIPITDTKGNSAKNLIGELHDAGVKVNVTAIMNLKQVEEIITVLGNGTPAYISIFAGRIADTGIDPVSVMGNVVSILHEYPHIELIWASTREVFNVIQANQIGCHIITATNSILKKLDLLGKNLEEFSLETVQMFYQDALHAGYHL